MNKIALLTALTIATLLALAAACGSTEPEIVEVEVEKPVIQEIVRTVEVEKPVIQEVVKTVEVEVPVEMDRLPPLILGHLNAFTGSLSYFGPAHRNAAALAADHVNLAGGIQGASVVIRSRDTAVSPVQGVDAARALVEVENAVAIVGSLASGVTLPVAESVTIPNRVLQVTGASTSPAITVLEDNDFLFRTAASDAAQGVVLARLAIEEGYESAGILYINNAYGEGLADQFTDTFTELGGSVTASVPHEDTQPHLRVRTRKGHRVRPRRPHSHELPRAGRDIPARVA